MSQTGSYPPNLHEGSRSEYLAQFVFSAFGTSIPVPHQEDTGLDLYCTLAERVGNRAWPRHHYAVQVKSTDDPWVFESWDSVRWFVEFPSPLFFCVVDKKQGRLRVYQTLSRFRIWSCGVRLERLVMVPGGTEDDTGERFSLGEAILDFTIGEILSGDFSQTAWDVLASWAAFDSTNIFQVRCNARERVFPFNYTTNKPLRDVVRVVERRARVEEDDLQKTLQILSWYLQYAGSRLYELGKEREALRVAMLLRKIDPNGANCGMMLDFFNMLGQLNSRMGFETTEWTSSLFQGLDRLNEIIDEESGLT